MYKRQVSYLSKPDEARSARAPLGYVRIKIFGRDILVKALVDSGNLYADLISDQLAKKLGLPYIKMNRDVGTASANGSLKIIGKIPRLKIFIEGIKKVLILSPYVVQGLAHQINLGQAFLRENHADMTFRPEGTLLRLGQEVSKLVTRLAPLGRSTICLLYTSPSPRD